MGRRGLPDRWIKYRPIGEKVAGTSFIAFKVPLKESLVKGLPENERFTPLVLMDSVPSVGLIIDLTNTDRYYNPQDFLRQGIRYEKIFCRGHEIPNQTVVDKFFSIVDAYLQSSSVDQSDDGKLIGVHCTHGLNRTGYLVCRYMIRRLGFSPEDAISAFEHARGYPMEREEYLKNLRENEDLPVTEVSDGHLAKQDEASCSGNSKDSTFSQRAKAGGNFSAFRNGPNTDSRSARSRTWDHRTEDYRNVHVDARNCGFRSFPRGPRSDSFSWPSDINNGFANSFSNVRAAGHPYYRDFGNSFNTEERVAHRSRDFSRRFYEPNRYHWQRETDYHHHSSTPSFYRDTSRRHRRSRNFRGKDHSV